MMDMPSLEASIVTSLPGCGFASRAVGELAGILPFLVLLNLSDAHS
jgi:hypothetical protein